MPGLSEGWAHRRNLASDLLFLLGSWSGNMVNIVRNVLEWKVDSYLTTKHMNNLANIYGTLCKTNVVLCETNF